MRPNLIGLMGHMGVGKDAVAALLHMAGYQRVALADAVREEVVGRLVTGYVWPKALYDDWASQGETDIGLTGDEVWIKPTSNRVRILLQFWGMYQREANPSHWVEIMAGKVRGKCSVVSDVRFENEVAAIREQGGVIWRVIRHNREASVGIPGHISETQMDGIGADKHIYNLGHMIDLAKTVRREICQ